MLPKKQRITKRLFSESFSHSKTQANDNFTLKYKDILDLPTKTSIIVSKKVAKNAVDRNSLKRKIYDTTGKIIKNAKKPYVLMVFPKKTTTTLTNKELEESLIELLKKAKILE